MKNFFEAATEFADYLRANSRIRIDAEPEDQLKQPVQDLIKAAGAVHRLPVDTKPEAHAKEVGGTPDIGVTVNKLLCGFVELKAPGKGADPKRYKGHDRTQFDKFRALPNILYTDGSEWALYQNGERVGRIIRFENLEKLGKCAIDETSAGQLEMLLRQFLDWNPIVPKDPTELARELARLCRYLREEVETAMAEPDSSLAQLAKEWREVLFSDCNDARFTDAYAQTLTYGLLLAKFSGEEQLTIETAPTRLNVKHGLLAQAVRLLAQEEARRAIEVSLKLLIRVINAVNPAVLRKKGNEPWLYFYEDFLSAYDAKLRKDYGVYYTPHEVILAQVRLVAELLEGKFGKSLSYADDGVVFLDPGAGTGAYPLAAMQYALACVEQKFGAGMVGGRASVVAKNLHAFEILVGPYAVAHLRLTQAILDQGGKLPDNGLHVYLTDTLESPHAAPPSGTPPLIHKPLVEEHRRAQTVKAKTRVMVCMGNPPYDREQRDLNAPVSRRKGGWVRYAEGLKDSPERTKLEDFLEPAREAGYGIHIKNLYNDYVYFWRWALWKVFEQSAEPGIISFITASSYLTGPAFVGMREHMRRVLDELWIIDLEGDNLGARKTENVFNIQIPVAIAVGVRYATPHPKKPAKVRYAKLTGSRQDKLAALESVGSIKDLDFKPCGTGWQAPFKPEGTGDYFAWPLLTSIFPWQHTGVELKRTWPIGQTTQQLRQRWSMLCASSLEDRKALFIETPDRKITQSYRLLHDSSARSKPIAQLKRNSEEPTITRYGFRSLDRQWLIADMRLADRIKPCLWSVYSDRQVCITSMLMLTLGQGPAAFATHLVPDRHHFSGRGGKDVIPLYRDASAQCPNITDGLLDALSGETGKKVRAEDLFAYCYALMACPTYIEHFSEELSIPGPRIPITKDAALFKQAMNLGRRLIWLHTYGERFMPRGSKPGDIPQGSARCRKGIPEGEEDYPEQYAYDSEKMVLHVGEGRFGPVAPEVYEFSVSGLKVVQSWLAYRMAKGAGKKSSELDKIRPQRWTADMTHELLQLLWVLEHTLKLYPELQKLLDEVITGEVFTAAELPTPTPEECAAPADETEVDTGQIEVDLPTE